MKGHARAVDVLRLPYGAVAPESLAAENANRRDALLRARDALTVYEPHPANALSAVLGALRGTVWRDYAGPLVDSDAHLAAMVAGDG